MSSSTFSGRKGEDLDKEAFSYFCFLCLGVSGRLRESERVRGADDVRSGGKIFEEEAGCDVSALLDSDVELQRLAGGAGNGEEEDMIAITVERKGEVEMETG